MSVYSCTLQADKKTAGYHRTGIGQYGNELVSLQQQEAQLITKNNELKIEVEQLKGPADFLLPLP